MTLLREFVGGAALKAKLLTDGVIYAIDAVADSVIEGWVQTSNKLSTDDLILTLVQGEKILAVTRPRVERVDLSGEFKSGKGFIFVSSEPFPPSEELAIRIDVLTAKINGETKPLDKINLGRFQSSSRQATVAYPEALTGRSLSGWVALLPSGLSKPIWATDQNGLRLGISLGERRLDLENRYRPLVPISWSISLRADTEQVRVSNGPGNELFVVSLADRDFLTPAAGGLIRSKSIQEAVIGLATEYPLLLNPAFFELQEKDFVASSLVRKRATSGFFHDSDDLAVLTVTPRPSMQTLPIYPSQMDSFLLEVQSVDYSKGEQITDHIVARALVQQLKLVGSDSLSHQQLRYLRDTPDYRYSGDLNLFQTASWSLNQGVSDVYQNLDDPLERLGLVVELLIQEMFQGYGLSFFSSHQLDGLLGEAGQVSKLVFLANTVPVPLSSTISNSILLNLLNDEFSNWYASLPAGHPIKSRDCLIVEDEPPSDISPTVGRREQLVVHLIGTVGHHSGVGKNADNSLKVLRERGYNVKVTPLSVNGTNFQNQIEKLALKPSELNIVHLQPDFFSRLLDAVPPSAVRERLIGYFAWETQSLPPHLYEPISHCKRIWVPSKFSASAFSRISTAEVEVVRHAVDMPILERDACRKSWGLRDDAKTVLVTFDAHSSLYRKNPVNSLRLFRECLRDVPGASLLLRVRNFRSLQAWAADGDRFAAEFLVELRRTQELGVVTLVAEEMTEAEHASLIFASDVVLSMHRAEGFGYSLAEAMLAGVPTVATGFSGNLEFQDLSNSFLIDYRLVEVDQDCYPWSGPGDVWAEPSRSHALELLVGVLSGTIDSSHVIARGVNRIRSDFSLEAMSERYVELIDRYASA